MKIENGKFDKDTANFVKSPNTSGKFSESLPDTIVIHYTAGKSAESSIETLTDPDVPASAHVVIARDGTSTQLVPFDKIAWHAGKSAWGDRTGLNKYSIGIELDNAGRLTKSGSKCTAWFGRAYSEEEVIEAVHRNENDPSYWHLFTEEQIAKTYDICRFLIKEYDIKKILGHEEIAPKRKIDPGPAFPLDKMRNKLLHADRSDRDEEKNTDKIPENPGEVTASMLNIRSGPSTRNQTVSNPLQRGTLVNILDESEDWYQVETTVKGWVSRRFIEPQE